MWYDAKFYIKITKLWPICKIMVFIAKSWPFFIPHLMFLLLKSSIIYCLNRFLYVITSKPSFWLSTCCILWLRTINKVTLKCAVVQNHISGISIFGLSDISIFGFVLGPKELLNSSLGTKNCLGAVARGGSRILKRGSEYTIIKITPIYSYILTLWLNKHKW